MLVNSGVWVSVGWIIEMVILLFCSFWCNVLEKLVIVCMVEE